MISKGGLLKFVKYTLVFSNAFGFVLSIFLGLFGAAYPKKQFPLGYKGREMALCSLFCMLITTIGYCGAQNHNRILLIVYGASNVMIVIIVVILWFLFKENSILGNKDISNMFITTLAITIAVMFLFSFILAFHVDTLKDNSQDSIMSQSHQLLQQTTALLQRQQQQQQHHQQLLMGPLKHQLGPASAPADQLLQSAATTTTMNLQQQHHHHHGALPTSGAQQLPTNSSSTSCALHQQHQVQTGAVGGHSLHPGLHAETPMLTAGGLHNPYGPPPMQPSSRQAPLVSPIQLLPPPPPMLKTSSRNKTLTGSSQLPPHPPAAPHLQQALLSPPQVPQPMASGEHQQVSPLLRNQSSPLPGGGAVMASSLAQQHVGAYGQLRGPLSKTSMHYSPPQKHHQLQQQQQQHHQSQQCHPTATGALMSSSPSPSPSPPPPSMHQASIHHHQATTMLRDSAQRLIQAGGPRGMPPPAPPSSAGCSVQYCTFQCDRTV